MSKSPIETMIDASVTCVKCKKPPKECDAIGACWVKCSCGWTHEPGKRCRNPATTRCTGKLRPPKPKIYHRAKKMNALGQVSALCFVRPRPIDLKRASWTLRDEDTTCPKCLAIIANKKAA